MKNKLNISAILLLVGFFFIQTSCKERIFDQPESTKYKYTLKKGDTLISIATLKTMLTSELTLLDTGVVIRGTVIANGSSGNYYKAIVIQDSTEIGEQSAIEIGLNAYGIHNDYPIGQMVYIECRGLYLGTYGGITKLGADYEGSVGRINEPLIGKYFFKDDAGKSIVPKAVKINELASVPVNTLVQIDSAQFKLSELSKTFADAGNKVTSDVQIEDKTGSSVIRTSGYASFASNKVPSGNGSIIVVNAMYNGGRQLMIRNYNEVNLNGQRTDNVLFLKDFEYPDLLDAGTVTVDNLVTGNWLAYNTIGNTPWLTGEHGGNSYANISNYNASTASNTAAESWFISPSFDLTTTGNPVLRFMNAYSYSGSPLKLKISTDYTGSGDPSLATWTDVSYTLSTGYFAWVNSGDIDLTPYKESSVYFAFVYLGSDYSGSTWEVDDISITDVASE